MIKHYPLGDLWLQLDTTSDHLCLVNALAAEVVQWQQHGVVGEALIRTLLERYDVGEARLRADIEALQANLEPPSEVVFRDPHGYVPVVSPLPSRPAVIVSSTVLHVPGFAIHIESESDAIVSELDRLFRLSADETLQSASQLVHLHLQLICRDKDCLIVLAGDSCLDTGHGTADTVMKCLRCINLQCALSLPGTFFIHAAAVASGARGLLLPARGGSGKSTLTASLVQRGYCLVNDDIVSLRLVSEQLIPVPLCVSLKEGSWPILTELWETKKADTEYGQPPRRLRYWPPDDSQACREATHCSMVVVPQYSRNCDGHHLVRLSPTDLLVELLDAGASLDRPVDPAQLESLCRWLNGVSAWRLEYADLDTAHAAIERLWQTVTISVTC